MRQVPCYLIIGNGRLARHMLNYLSLLNLDYVHWHRSQSIDLLPELVSRVTHIMVLISDDAIEAFISQHLLSQEQPNGIQPYIIHCSGSLNSNIAYGVHPLMTFGDKLYHMEHYQSIPLIIDQHAPEKSVLLPGWPNPELRINPQQKSYYHALCVLSGNFSCLLWQKLLSEFEAKFGWSKEHVFPYLQQQTSNIIELGDKALTGPLVRGDQATLNRNYAALKADPFAEVFQSFVKAYELMRSKHHDN